jgi:hypothetical protein
MHKDILAAALGLDEDAIARLDSLKSSLPLNCALTKFAINFGPNA